MSLQALGPYSVSKTALLGLTRALAPELAQSNIRVNCVAPGIIKTRFSSAVRRQTHSFDPLLSFPTCVETTYQRAPTLHKAASPYVTVARLDKQ